MATNFPPPKKGRRHAHACVSWIRGNYPLLPFTAIDFFRPPIALYQTKIFFSRGFPPKGDLKTSCPPIHYGELIGGAASPRFFPKEGGGGPVLDLEGERGSDSEREMSEEAGKKNATGLRELFYVIWQMLPFPANPNPQPEGRLAISLIGGGLEGGGDKEWAKKGT